MDDFTGKVVLVTGAARACGRVIAEDFAKRGARVVVDDIDDDGGNETVARITADGGEARFVHADVGIEAEVAALVDSILATEGRLDCAVNNAGAETTGLIDLTAVPENGLYAATKGGTDALTKAAAIEVAKDGISVNSIAFMGADVENGMFQRFFETAHVPLDQIMAAVPIGRLLKPEELCAAVRYLCSDDARFVVGTTLVLDGGFTAQ